MSTVVPMATAPPLTPCICSSAWAPEGAASVDTGTVRVAVPPAVELPGAVGTPLVVPVAVLSTPGVEDATPPVVVAAAGCGTTTPAGDAATPAGVDAAPVMGVPGSAAHAGVTRGPGAPPVA
jgi:hypothetical protein